MIAVLQEVRSLTGKITIKDPLDQSDITATVFNDAVGRGDARVILETGVSTWSPGDAFYGAVQEAAELFAAAYVLWRYKPTAESSNSQAMEFEDRALNICKSIAQSSTQGVIIASKPYKSYPLNPSGSIHRSLQPGANTLAGDD